MNNYQAARLEVARLINVNIKEITYVLYKVRTESFYTSFEIPKKDGSARVISAPNRKLKWIQRRLAEALKSRHEHFMAINNIKSNISHGFEKNKSIMTNAYIHRRKKYLLNMDIEDFFPSFNFGRVQGYFYKSREFMFSKEVSTIIAQLACYQGKLPQGAPTSPIIANLIFNIVDLHILALAKRYKLDYTRYADDMTFSTNDEKFRANHHSFIRELTKLLQRNGFQVNKEKTRLQYYSSRQEVTGLTVNKKINASRDFINTTRAMANQLFKTGSYNIGGKVGTIDQLEGRFAFINQSDWFNNKLGHAKKKCHVKNSPSAFNKRERQYQYFLFYKYFFKPVQPIIVTEGETDILHIKAALMKYYNNYPKLIAKEQGQFRFKIFFLARTDRLEYFLGISPYGADTMKNIWNWYTGKNNCTNIFNYLNKKSEQNSLGKVNPVILLFDNEQKSDKPLKKFIDHTGLSLENSDISQHLEEVISKHLIANLYLQTIPLVKNVKECEIEDLYSKDILSVTINGKTFARSDNFDTNTHFGKKYFSLYIRENYQKIDYQNFKPVLDSINKIVEL